MMACVAQAEDDAITIDPNELEDAIWVSRADVSARWRATPTRRHRAAALRHRAHAADAWAED